MTDAEAEAISKEAKAILKNPRRFSEALSLRTRQAIARFGKAARHPLCLAGLSLWESDAALSKLKKDAVSTNESLKSWERLKKKAQALYDRFYKERKQKEVIEAVALLQKIKENLPALREAHQAQANLLSWRREVRTHFAQQFEHEQLVAEIKKNTSALRALPRVHKRWKAFSNSARLKHGELRELGILQLLRDKKIRAEQAKGGAVAGYTKAARGGERPLSDDEWQGRLTAREIHSHLTATDGKAVAGDKEAKEVRRTTRRLKIQLDEDQVGRKSKEPARPKKQKQSKPLGRPPRSEVDWYPVENLAALEHALVQDAIGKKGKKAPGGPWSWAPTVEDQQKQAAIELEIARLKRRLSKMRRA